jgi:predicted GNAT family acetyltransferase
MRCFLNVYRKLGGARPALDRRQPFYVSDPKSLAKGIEAIDMEQASLDSIDELTELACEMVCEDLKLAPNEIDRRKYRLRMTERIVDGRAYLCRDESGQPIFKCDLAVCGPEGALLEGVYTPKSWRGKGVATRAIATLCKDLFESETKVPFVVLHVDERNKAARAVYEKVGFKQTNDFRLVLMPNA